MSEPKPWGDSESERPMGTNSCIDCGCDGAHFCVGKRSEAGAAIYSLLTDPIRAIRNRKAENNGL